MTPAVEIKNLRKTYAGGKKSPPKEALKGIDLVVPRGELRSQLATLINLLMQKKIGKGVNREEDTSRLPVKQNGSARGKKDKAKN